MRTSYKIFGVLAGAAAIVVSCGAASHLRALQPPTVPAVQPIAAPVITTVPRNPFQRGIDIDWYHYQGQQVTPDALATRAYLNRLHANAVSISFPFFMNGTRPGSVHRTIATPTPGQLATAIGIFEQAGMYISLRPLLDEKSLGRSRVGWVPSSQPRWFRSYERFLKPYAEMAQRQRVNEFIVGTEMKGFDLSPAWNGLVRKMRGWYHGTLACADNWDRLVTRGCAVKIQTVDAYSPAHSFNFAASWEQFDRRLQPGMVETEVGIAAAKYAWHKPWILNWPVGGVDPQTQAQWFTAACKASRSTHLGGIYFWSIGLATTQPVGPTLASQTTWTGGPGARAIAHCFRGIAR